jgi:hypothetical protein
MSIVHIQDILTEQVIISLESKKTTIYYVSYP